VTIALGVDWSLRFPERWLGRALNFRPLVWIGLLSYSLYLWQQPFFADGVRMAIPLRLAMLLTVAITSYFGVEKPFLALRQRIELHRRRLPATVLAPESSKPELLPAE
jgi:peptidoglycan/LPS O-acetylase OafA/YrhL